MDAVFQHRLQARQRLQVRLPHALVGGDNRCVAGGRADFPENRGLDRRDLPLEAVLGHGPRRLLLRGEPESVHVLAGRPAVAGDALRRLELTLRLVPGPLRCVGQPGAVEDVRPQTHARHRLDSAGDADIDGARCYQPCDHVVRLLRGAALRINRRSGDRVRQAGRKPGVSRDVRRLLARLRHATADDLLDQLGLDAGALDHLRLRVGEQLHRVQPRQLPVALADRRSHRLDNDSFRHGCSPSVRMHSTFVWARATLAGEV